MMFAVYRNVIWIIEQILSQSPHLQTELKINKLSFFTSTTFGRSNAHLGVRGTQFSYQHSAGNTCFGIIKLYSKDSTSMGNAGPFEYIEATVQKMSIQGMQQQTTQIL